MAAKELSYLLSDLRIRQSVCAFQNLRIREVKHGQDLLPRDGRIEHQELMDGFAAFKKIDEALHGHPCAPETWHTTEAPGVSPDGLIQAISCSAAMSSG
jgi:hypothetical protein